MLSKRLIQLLKSSKGRNYTTQQVEVGVEQQLRYRSEAGVLTEDDVKKADQIIDDKSVEK